MYSGSLAFWIVIFTVTGVTLYSYGLGHVHVARLSWYLYICHQVLHWAMTFYAKTRLESSHRLKPFHYWMAGMNLIFVLLHLARTRFTGRHRSEGHPHQNFGLIGWSLSYYFLLAKSNKRGIVFGYSIPFTQGVLELFEEGLCYYFSWAVLFSFWNIPSPEGTFSLSLKLTFEIIFILHSCLIQSHTHENKYWTALLELMVIIYFYPLLDRDRYADTFLPSLYLFAVVFVITQIHELCTRVVVKAAIMIAIAPLILVLYNHIDTTGLDTYYRYAQQDINEARCVFPLMYYVILFLILILITCAFWLFKLCRFIARLIVNVLV